MRAIVHSLALAKFAGHFYAGTAYGEDLLRQEELDLAHGQEIADTFQIRVVLGLIDGVYDPRKRLERVHLDEEAGVVEPVEHQVEDPELERGVETRVAGKLGEGSHRGAADLEVHRVGSQEDFGGTVGERDGDAPRTEVGEILVVVRFLEALDHFSVRRVTPRHPFERFGDGSDGVHLNLFRRQFDLWEKPRRERRWVERDPSAATEVDHVEIFGEGFGKLSELKAAPHHVPDFDQMLHRAMVEWIEHYGDVKGDDSSPLLDSASIKMIL